VILRVTEFIVELPSETIWETTTMTQSIQCERTCTNAETNHLTENEYHELLMAEPRRMALDILTNTTTPVDLKETCRQ